MFMQIADRLSRFTRRLPATSPAAHEQRAEQRQSGWHESSWVMAQGVDVIELPASAVASLFPDTQPAFYDTGDELRAA